MDDGLAAIAQPDIGRVGGLTEANRVCDLAAARGLRIVPHAWKTGLSIAAAVNFAAATPGCEFVEYGWNRAINAPSRNASIWQMVAA